MCDLALDPPHTEPGGDDDAVGSREAAVGEQALDVLGLDPVDLDVGAVMEAGVPERLGDREVGVGQADVLADDPDPTRVGRRLDPADQRLPVLQIGLGVGRPRISVRRVVEALLVEHQWDVVEAVGVGGVHDRLDRHVAQRRDLALQAIGDRASDRQTITSGWMPRLRNSVTRVLGRFGLLLARRADERHQGHMDVADVLAADIHAELPNGLEERQDLDVADGAADLGDHDVDVVGRRGGRCAP